jgi:hypothetical protein
VTVAVRRPNGEVEQVQVGTAVQSGDGFSLQLGDLTIGGAPVPAPARSAAPPIPAGGLVFPPYGRSKGLPIVGASLQDLEFYASGSRRSLADPAKARFHEKERALLAAIEAEIARQKGGEVGPAKGSAPRDDDSPPPDDGDIPF